MRSHLRCLALAVALAACDETDVVGTTAEPSLDAQLRATMTQWGVMPIAPLAPRDPALVALGQALFFDPVLSGNRDVSCATCHDPRTHTTDRRALSLGTGHDRAPTPRNSASTCGCRPSVVSITCFRTARASEAS